MRFKEWKKYKLGEIATFYNGRAYKNDEFKISGTPIVRIQNLTGEGKTVYSDLILERNKYIDFDDLIYAWSATFGPYMWKGSKSIYHYHIWKIECNRKILDKDFFYYKLRYISEALKAGGNGTLFTHITKSFIENFETTLPNISIQKKISSILSSLDDKIELNCQTNQTLEAIAHTLFKEMCMPKRNILEDGWKIGKIKDFTTNIQYGYTESASREKIGPKFLRITDIQNGKVEWSLVPYCLIDEKSFEKYKIKNYDIVIARTGASTGENALIVNPPDSVFASYLIRIQFNNPQRALFFGKLLRTKSYLEFIGAIKTGSAQPNANAQQLTDYNLALPPQNILDKYFQIVNDLELKKVENQNQTATLILLRNSLLPKLMKGEIEALV